MKATKTNRDETSKEIVLTIETDGGYETDEAVRQHELRDFLKERFSKKEVEKRVAEGDQSVAITCEFKGNKIILTGCESFVSANIEQFYNVHEAEENGHLIGQICELSGVPREMSYVPSIEEVHKDHRDVFQRAGKKRESKLSDSEKKDAENFLSAILEVRGQADKEILIERMMIFPNDEGYTVFSDQGKLFKISAILEGAQSLSAAKPEEASALQGIIDLFDKKAGVEGRDKVIAPQTGVTDGSKNVEMPRKEDKKDSELGGVSAKGDFIAISEDNDLKKYQEKPNTSCIAKASYRFLALLGIKRGGGRGDD